MATACEAIVDNPAQASEMTSRANFVAVVRNGTAILGLYAYAAAMKSWNSGAEYLSTNGRICDR